MFNHIKPLMAFGATVVVAAAVMIGATFTPFVSVQCIMCPAFPVGSAITLPSSSLFNGLDGWDVLSVAVALAVFALMTVQTRRLIAAAATLATAVTALALVTIEAVNASGRVTGGDAVGPPMELTPSGPRPYVPAGSFTPPLLLDAGFYIFLAAAVVAVIAAAGVVVLILRSRRRGGESVGVNAAQPMLQGRIPN